MRVTGGIYSRRQVACPPGVIRPAMDRMRESVFSILGDLSGCSFLDLFSGSGIIGIEAASRGASYITFVEMDRKKIGVLKKNTSIVESEAVVIANKSERFLAHCTRNYDIVFADPPFPQKGKAALLKLIHEKSILVDGGLCLIHFPEEESLPERVGNLVLSDKRKYGRSIVNFYRSATDLSTGTT